MKKLSLITVVLALLLGGTFCMSTSAQADSYYFVHGTDGKVEYPGNTYGVAIKGWGLEFTEKAYTGNWIHYSVPGPPGPANAKLQFIVLRYYKSNLTGSFQQVDVYDGQYKLGTFYPSAGNIGWNTVYIYMGQYGSSYVTAGTAVGASFYAKAGASSTDFKIASVWGIYY